MGGFGFVCAYRLERVNRGLKVAGFHDGFRRLTGRVVHRRRRVINGNSLRIRDQIEGGFINAVACYHFHPEMEVNMSGDEIGRFQFPGGRRISFQVVQGQGRLERSTYHPEFNISLENFCLAVDFADPNLR